MKSGVLKTGAKRMSGMVMQAAAGRLAATAAAGREPPGVRKPGFMKKLNVNEEGGGVGMPFFVPSLHGEAVSPGKAAATTVKAAAATVKVAAATVRTTGSAIKIAALLLHIQPVVIMLIIPVMIIMSASAFFEYIGGLFASVAFFTQVDEVSLAYTEVTSLDASLARNLAQSGLDVYVDGVYVSPYVLGEYIRTDAESVIYYFDSTYRYWMFNRPAAPVDWDNLNDRYYSPDHDIRDELLALHAALNTVTRSEGRIDLTRMSLSDYLEKTGAPGAKEFKERMALADALGSTNPNPSLRNPSQSGQFTVIRRMGYTYNHDEQKIRLDNSVMIAFGGDVLSPLSGEVAEVNAGKVVIGSGKEKVYLWGLNSVSVTTGQKVRAGEKIAVSPGVISMAHSKSIAQLNPVLSMSGYRNFAAGGTGATPLAVALTEYADGVQREGLRYSRWFYSNPQEPRHEWCAIFVCYCYHMSGRASQIPRTASVGDMCNKAGKYYETDKAYVPSPGDLVIFDNTKNGYPDHVGMVVSFDAGGLLRVIEGNYSDELRLTAYNLKAARASGKICGFIIPNTGKP